MYLSNNYLGLRYGSVVTYMKGQHNKKDQRNLQQNSFGHLPKSGTSEINST